MVYYRRVWRAEAEEQIDRIDRMIARLRQERDVWVNYASVGPRAWRYAVDPEALEGEAAEAAPAHEPEAEAEPVDESEPAPVAKAKAKPVARKRARRSS